MDKSSIVRPFSPIFHSSWPQGNLDSGWVHITDTWLQSGQQKRCTKNSRRFTICTEQKCQKPQGEKPKFSECLQSWVRKLNIDEFQSMDFWLFLNKNPDIFIFPYGFVKKNMLVSYGFPALSSILGAQNQHR